MNSDMSMTVPPPRTTVERLHGALRLLDRIPHDFIALVSRFSIAAVFWQSGQTKVDGWHVTDNAVYLFENEYKVPFVDPWLAAHLAAFAEHFFPVLLVIGLASRLSALALLGMTLVIEIFVYPDAWPTHGTWAVCFLVIAAGGPGRLSLDYLIARRFGLLG
ncbi:DoxX family protein [Rhizobium sp. BK251]|uniref:DoxX family protein n=1 Tax=Rhizobium sp. BK251 TaxID=2512125 RepID=UPI00104A67AA|nr:DoxX family protein [Rhizobium sp. BK251]TCL70347.1 putative oxidoreductase [Rhizobium sp. BK251]